MYVVDYLCFTDLHCDYTQFVTKVNAHATYKDIILKCYREFYSVFPYTSLLYPRVYRGWYAYIISNLTCREYNPLCQATQRGPSPVYTQDAKWVEPLRWYTHVITFSDVVYDFWGQLHEELISL